LKVLDEEFNEVISMEGSKSNIPEMETKVMEQKKRLEEIKSYQAKKKSDAFAKRYEELALDALLENIEKTLRHAKEGEPDAREEAYRNLLRLTDNVDELEDMQVFSRLEIKLEDMENRIQKDQNLLSPEDQKEFLNLKADLAQAKSRKDTSFVHSLEQRNERLTQKCIEKDIENDIGLWQCFASAQYRCLEKMGRLTDASILTFLQDGVQAIQEKSCEKLKKVVRTLFQIVPGLADCVKEELGVTGGKISGKMLDEFGDIH